MLLLTLSLQTPGRGVEKRGKLWMRLFLVLRTGSCDGVWAAPEMVVAAAYWFYPVFIVHCTVPVVGYSCVHNFLVLDVDCFCAS